MNSVWKDELLNWLIFVNLLISKIFSSYHWMWWIVITTKYYYRKNWICEYRWSSQTVFCPITVLKNLKLTCSTTTFVYPWIDPTVCDFFLFIYLFCQQSFQCKYLFISSSFAIVVILSCTLVLHKTIGGKYPLVLIWTICDSYQILEN